MPYVAPVIAHVDSLGRLYCIDCEPELIGYPVYGDMWFTAEDKCERCSKVLERVPSSAYVKVS